MTAQIFAFMTASAHRFEEGCSDPEEQHGWIDWSWSHTQLHESRNDVRPRIDSPEDDEHLADEIRDLIGDATGWENNGDGTLYDQNPYESLEDGWDYTYAVHFSKKYHHATKGWVEERFDPIEFLKSFQECEHCGGLIKTSLKRPVCFDCAEMYEVEGVENGAVALAIETARHNNVFPTVDELDAAESDDLESESE
ncbi:hypothetical protein LZ318_11845 [Saccharopolyspora indica]|uniref:hypothetical protein n=1 Tax=Saccharopolyspora indica TaxID=1229659 RepID=UPI0022EB953B|nr:hypothetical protein [Saccharopolyspora indica]MDA3643796.1 hypothetical protein [Saccharopolyspora indica]